MIGSEFGRGVECGLLVKTSLLADLGQLHVSDSAFGLCHCSAGFPEPRTTYIVARPVIRLSSCERQQTVLCPCMRINVQVT